MFRVDMGAAAEVCHITQRGAELFGLPDDVDDLVPGRRLRVQYEHIGGVQDLLVWMLASLGSSSPTCMFTFGGAQD